MEGVSDSSRGRSSSPRAKPWSAADSDRCECVLKVMPDDVLLGRGSGPNDHVGNITFRDLVHGRKVEYLSTNHRQTKAVIAKDIVDQVYQQGGRFLKKLGVVESAKVLPKLLATKNAMDDSENDRADAANPGPCEVYQIQKHTTVMEKTKQALRQNQRNASPCPPENRSMSPTKDPANVRRDSMGRANNLSPDTPPHGIPHNSNNNNNNNNWNGVSMGNIPTTLNNSSHDNNNGQRHHGGQFHNNNNNNNNMRDSYDIPNMNYSSSAAQGQNQDSYQQQMYQQQQEVINLQKQHDLLQLQYQQRQQQQQQNQQQQFQSQQLEIETRNKQLLEEQLELQIRQEQLRQLQQQSLQKLANNTAMYSSRQQDATNDPQFHRSENTPNQAQNAPPAVLNGYATYTTTLDAIEDGHQNSHDGLADPQGSMNKSDGASLDTETKFDDKSMQMSTMMGSFKDMSVKSGEDHSMHGSTQSIGTIDNVPASLGLSMVNMSGISIMSLMNDSTDSLFKNPQKAGNDVGAKNAMWSTHAPSSSTAPLADVIESTNPAAVAAAAVLGKPVPVFDRAQRRWSGGYVPDTTEVPIKRRVNRRGSLQHNNSNNSNDMNQMQATASAMLAMAAAEHNQQLQQQQYMSQSFNYTHSPNGHSYGGSQEIMNPPNQGFLMENGGYSMNVPFQG